MTRAKVSERACPDCGSPSRGNPCWWYLDNPRHVGSNAEAPCEEYFWLHGELASERFRQGRRIRRWMIALGIIVVALIALSLRMALAHDFYPAHCCSDRDCAPLAGSRVRITALGYVVDGKFIVPLSETRKSMDGRYHGCFPKPDELKCFFAPVPGS